MPEEVQASIQDIAQRLVKGLGLNTTLVNIEMIYDPEKDQAFVIEVNPRLAGQFADLFEKVKGINTYQLLLELTLGREITFPNHGLYNYGTSFPLRRFENAYVRRIPSQEEIEALHLEFPESLINIRAREGIALSDILQDDYSYGYAIINIAANTKEELERKRDIITRKLNFEFEPINKPS